MILSLLLLACQPDATAPSWPYDLPPGFPPPLVPENNPISDAKVELGRHLFYDPRLSGNGEQACADCHKQELAFSDGLVLPLGSTGDTIPRNAMSLPNAAWWSTYTWMNPVLTTLEDQALVPMFAELPTELGMTHAMSTIVGRLQEDGQYRRMFQEAFPHVTRIDLSTIVASIASFERTLISGDSPYDRYLYGGDDDALSPSAKLGMDVFFSEVAECYHCHGGPLFSTAFVSENQVSAEPSFINTGLYNLDANGSYPEPNTGLYAFTGVDYDRGRIRVPTLRNVAVTAPYFHDGSAATLDDVLDHYIAGGRTIAEGPYAGVGADNPWKHPLVRPFELTAEERQGLLDFMAALTDEQFLTNPALSNPFER